MDKKLKSGSAAKRGNKAVSKAATKQSKKSDDKRDKKKKSHRKGATCRSKSEPLKRLNSIVCCEFPRCKKCFRGPCEIPKHLFGRQVGCPSMRNNTFKCEMPDCYWTTSPGDGFKRRYMDHLKEQHKLTDQQPPAQYQSGAFSMIPPGAQPFSWTLPISKDHAHSGGGTDWVSSYRKLDLGSIQKLAKDATPCQIYDHTSFKRVSKPNTNQIITWTIYGCTCVEFNPKAPIAAGLGVKCFHSKIMRKRYQEVRDAISKDILSKKHEHTDKVTKGCHQCSQPLIFGTLQFRPDALQIDSGLVEGTYKHDIQETKTPQRVEAFRPIIRQITIDDQKHEFDFSMSAKGRVDYHNSMIHDTLQVLKPIQTIPRQTFENAQLYLKFVQSNYDLFQLWIHGKKEHPIYFGMQDSGTISFAQSVIQGLFTLSKFQTAVINHQCTEKCVWCFMNTIENELRNEKRGDKPLRDLLWHMHAEDKLPDYKTNELYDASDFLGRLLKSMIDCNEDYKQLVSFEMHDMYTCDTCKFSTVTTEEGILMDVELKENLYQSIYCRLKTKLGIRCNNAFCLQSKKECLNNVFTKMPDQLIISIKREVNNRKTTSAILFPDNLIIPSEWIKDKSPSKVYEIAAFIKHKGSYDISKGHYVTYVMHNCKWYEYNGSEVEDIGHDLIENIKQQAGIIYYKASAFQPAEIQPVLEGFNGYNSEMRDRNLGTNIVKNFNHGRFSFEAIRPPLNPTNTQKMFNSGNATVKDIVGPSEEQNIKQALVLKESIDCYMSNKTNQKVLDLGGGKGESVLQFKGFDCQITIVEPSGTFIKEAQKQFKGEEFKHVSFVKALIQDYIYTTKYDFILSSQVLMFLNDLEIRSMLSNANENLEDEGVIVIQQCIWDKQTPYCTKDGCYMRTHEELMRLFQSSGLRIISHSNAIAPADEFITRVYVLKQVREDTLFQTRHRQIEPEDSLENVKNALIKLLKGQQWLLADTECEQYQPGRIEDNRWGWNRGGITEIALADFVLTSSGVPIQYEVHPLLVYHRMFKASNINQDQCNYLGIQKDEANLRNEITDDDKDTITSMFKDTGMIAWNATFDERLMQFALDNPGVVSGKTLCLNEVLRRLGLDVNSALICKIIGYGNPSHTAYDDVCFHGQLLQWILNLTQSELDHVKVKPLEKFIRPEVKIVHSENQTEERK